MNNSKISVIIPVYNTEKYVSKSIESILNQTYKNIEIILVDDGSIDNSGKICDEYAENYKNIIVIHKQNGGLSSARNAGLDCVKEDTDYVLFLDSDDTLENEAINILITKALDEKSDICLPDRFYKVDLNNNKILSYHLQKNMNFTNVQEFFFNVYMKGRCWRATSVLYSKKVIDNIRFQKGRIAEDYFFNIECLSIVKKISIISYPTLNVLIRNDSISHTFHNGFEETVWDMDSAAINFLKNKNIYNDINKKIIDAFLWRNLILYIISILFFSGKALSKIDKIDKINYIVNNKKSRNVLRNKYPYPFFNDKKSKLAFMLLSLYFRIKIDYIINKIYKIN